jgi:DNA invertase Pin-like site-specific DNA recombinase
VTSAAIYLRISQDRSGEMLGVDRQREDCEALCKRNKWTVVETFVDNDVSAYSRRKIRKGYLAMLEAVKEGRVDAVVAWHPDRLHRSTRELEDFIDIIEKSGAQVATTQAGHYDLTTPSGRMTARIVGAVAKHESEHKAERTGRQREQAARAGKYHGGRRPYGYEADGKTIREPEAELIRDGAERILAGQSLRRIADDWNEHRIPTSSGRQWTITTMRTMFAGPRLAGLRVHRGEIVGDATWPAILDRETFEKLQLILGDPRRRQNCARPTYLLTGMLRCGRCGMVMHASYTAEGRLRYACNVKPGRDACGRVAISAELASDPDRGFDSLDELITEAALYRITSPAVASAMSKPKKKGPDHVRAIAECERQLEVLAADHGAGTISRREWLAARAAIDTRLNSARRALARETGTEALGPLRGVDARAVWVDLDLERQRAILSALIDCIIIGPANGRSRFAADRVDIVWKV